MGIREHFYLPLKTVQPKVAMQCDFCTLSASVYPSIIVDIFPLNFTHHNFSVHKYLKVTAEMDILPIIFQSYICSERPVPSNPVNSAEHGWYMCNLL